MSDLDPQQAEMRDRIEGVISLAAPLLNVLLAVGERISRIAEPTDHEYYPIRPGGEHSSLGEAGQVLDAEATEEDQGE